MLNEDHMHFAVFSEAGLDAETVCPLQRLT